MKFNWKLNASAKIILSDGIRNAPVRSANPKSQQRSKGFLGQLTGYKLLREKILLFCGARLPYTNISCTTDWWARLRLLTYVNCGEGRNLYYWIVFPRGCKCYLKWADLPNKKIINRETSVSLPLHVLCASSLKTVSRLRKPLKIKIYKFLVCETTCDISFKFIIPLLFFKVRYIKHCSKANFAFVFKYQGPITCWSDLVPFHFLLRLAYF
jgi:hypothetical protein